MDMNSVLMAIEVIVPISVFWIMFWFATRNNKKKKTINEED